jgi:hypothetical protein
VFDVALYTFLETAAKASIKYVPEGSVISLKYPPVGPPKPALAPIDPPCPFEILVTLRPLMLVELFPLKAGTAALIG